MIEPAYRATELITAPRGDGTHYILARPGEFLTVEQAELAGLVEKPAVRTAKVEGPSRAARRR